MEAVDATRAAVGQAGAAVDAAVEKIRAAGVALEKMKAGAASQQHGRATVVDLAFSIKRRSTGWRTGATVMHETHGRGVIVEVRQNHDVTIAFDN